MVRVAIVAEEESEQLSNIRKAMAKRKLEAVFVPVGDIVLSVRGGVAKAFAGARNLREFEGVFLQLPSQFLLFAEPLLQELAAEGVYCQIKPTAFNDLSNRPLMYATLHLRGIPSLRTSLVADQQGAQDAISQYGFPVLLEVFVGTRRRQRIYVQSEEVLRSHLKSLPEQYDLIAVREHAAGSLHESIIVGDAVFTTQSAWNKEKMEHAKRKSATKLSEHEQEVMRRAARAVGCDVALVRAVDGKVISVRSTFDLAPYAAAAGVDIAAKIAEFYEGRLA